MTAQPRLRLVLLLLWVACQGELLAAKSDNLDQISYDIVIGQLKQRILLGMNRSEPPQVNQVRAYTHYVQNSTSRVLLLSSQAGGFQRQDVISFKLDSCLSSHALDIDRALLVFRVRHISDRRQLDARGQYHRLARDKASNCRLKKKVSPHKGRRWQRRHLTESGAGTNTAVGAGTNTGAGAGTNPGAGTGTTNTGTGTGTTNTGAGAGTTNTGAGAGTNPGAGSGTTNTGAGAGTNTGAGSGTTNTGAGAGTNTGAGAGTNTGAGAGTRNTSLAGSVLHLETPVSIYNPTTPGTPYDARLDSINSITGNSAFPAVDHNRYTNEQTSDARVKIVVRVVNTTTDRKRSIAHQELEVRRNTVVLVSVPTKYLVRAALHPEHTLTLQIVCRRCSQRTWVESVYRLRRRHGSDWRRGRSRFPSPNRPYLYVDMSNNTCSGQSGSNVGRSGHSVSVSDVGRSGHSVSVSDVGRSGHSVSVSDVGRSGHSVSVSDVGRSGHSVSVSDVDRSGHSVSVSDVGRSGHSLSVSDVGRSGHSLSVSDVGRSGHSVSVSDVGRSWHSVSVSDGHHFGDDFLQQRGSE